MSESRYYDVWVCFTNGRQSHRAVEVPTLSGKLCNVEEAKKPETSFAHLDRVYAANGRQAIHDAIRQNAKRLK